MNFSDHYNDITGYITETATVSCNETVYGYDNESVITFWVFSDNKMEEMNENEVSLTNTLWINAPSEKMDDVYFNTKCIGYASDNGYDAVVVEADVKYCMLIEWNKEKYLTEAPLTGKRLTPAQRKTAIGKRKAKGQKRGNISRPKKAPIKGMKVDVMLANTGKLSPDRVERAIKQVRKKPPKITGVKEVQGVPYFKAEYNFKSITSKQTQMGYAVISEDKTYCDELFCSCADFFYRLYAPYVAAGLSVWNLPPKYKAKQNTTVDNAPHNHKWTHKRNKNGELYLCKHLWAFMAYYVTGDEGNTELSDEEIEGLISDYFGDVEVDADGEVVDVDTDSEEEDESANEFEKAFGKLYVSQKGKKIPRVTDRDEVEKGDRQTFYQLPQKDDDTEEELELDDEIEDTEE